MEQPKLINNISERVFDDLKQRLSRDTYEQFKQVLGWADDDAFKNIRVI